ncbi:MAG: choice-of-anchor D domain-containing protein [Verrucomicrobiia bacterium]
MGFANLRFWAAGVLVTVVLPFGNVAHGQSAPAKTNKILVYPTGTESVSQLKEHGIDSAVNYGSYWLVDATDAQVKSLHARYGDRAMNADYLNKVELAATALDTTVGEPAIPSHLKQSAMDGKRLRLVQFKGPVKPEWLQQVKSAGDVRIVSYIPNNAYVIWLDQNGETKLKTQLVPKGSIQWIGSYHPYYKIHKALLAVEPGNQGATVKVRVAAVTDSETASTVTTLEALGSVESSLARNGQEIIQMDVSPSAVSQIAQLPNVLWIEKVEPSRLLDEVQDLVLASQTNYPANLPPHGPTPRTLGGTSYLFFLTNTVGGGLASFTDPKTYPVVDISDTGIDNGQRYLRLADSSFYYLGDPNNSSRVVYTMPPWIAGDPDSQLGCTVSIDRKKAFRYIEAEDLYGPYGHGTLVASVLAGYDNGTNLVAQPSLALQTIISNIVVRIPGPESWNIPDCSIFNNGHGSPTSLTLTSSLPTGVANVCSPFVTTHTNINFTITSNQCDNGPLIVTTNILWTEVVTNYYSETRQDDYGFQLRMGVSPFGRIGVNRIFSQNLTLNTTDGGCVRDYGSVTLCANDLPAIISLSYLNSARIQNNSWSTTYDIHGSNGGYYSGNSQTYDIGVRDAILPPTCSGCSNSVPTPGPSPLNQEFIVVFACNSFLSDAIGDVITPGGSPDMVVTDPATAKNVISVGSSENARQYYTCDPDSSSNSFMMAPFSAPGPTQDGRFKPEIVAPGGSIFGAMLQMLPDLAASTNTCGMDNLVPTYPYIFDTINPDCSSTVPINFQLYQCNSGSSFAAPAVSGGIQLLWWYFQNRLTNEQGQHLLQPSPAMAKAYLCNSARYLPITNPQYTNTTDTLPSNLQGMGEMDLQRMFDGVPRVIRDESTPRAIDSPLTTTNPVPQQTYFSQSGQSYELRGQVASNGAPFRVTLAWTDVPGNPLAFMQLVNDLDLTVTIGGQTYKGNVFQGDHSVTGGASDSINNMKSVFLPAGGAVASGAPYTVIVRAHNIAGNGVPNINNSAVGQDFALVVYNSQTNFATLLDVPNLTTNNSCQTAMVIPTTFSFTNTLSRTVYHNVHPSPSAARGGADEFFKINLPTPGGVFTINTTGSTFDNVLSVWQVQVVPQPIYVRGECGALVEVTSTNGGLSSAVTFTADGSNDYYIVAEPRNDGPGGTLVLNVNATAPAISVTPSSLAFGNETVGLTSTPPLTVTYQNNTSVDINFYGISIAGANSNDFAIISDSCADGSLAPGQNCSIGIAFTPTAGGPRTAELVINDDATGSPRTVGLSGTGVAPEPSVCLSTGGSLSFGNNVATGSVSTVGVTITNCGSASLFITNMVISGSDHGLFTVSSDTCSGNTISSGGGPCTFNVNFAPTNAGPRSATLTINSSATNSPNIVALSGTGEVPTPRACLISGIVFGTQNSGTTSTPPKSVIITNCGSAVLHISSIGLSGANPGEFVLSGDTCSGNDIAVGGTCSFGVAFAPTSGGLRYATLTITSSGASSPNTVALSGTGQVPTPRACLIGSIAFGNQSSGTTSTPPKSVIITNCGTAELTNSISLTGPNAGEFVLSSDTCSGIGIDIGGTCSFSVGFAPTNMLAAAASVVINNNSAVNPKYVTLTGTGTGGQPDLLINKNLNIKKFIGKGVLTPTNSITVQTLTQNVKAKRKCISYVAIQNDGNAADSFRIQGIGDSGHFTVKYYLGSSKKLATDITAAVVAGTFSTPNMAAGAVTGDTTMIRVEVTATSAALKGETDDVDVSAFSNTDATKTDQVRVHVLVK